MTPEKTLFDYIDYKKYLREFIALQPKRGHGLRSAIAVAIRCQTAYISQVLSGDAQLSLEQADWLSTYLGHSKAEADFFLLLVQRARAGTPTLRRRFDQQIEVAISARLSLKSRLKIDEKLKPEDQAIYYSAWYYAAIHVLVTIPGYNTKSAIANKLALSLPRVSAILEFLVLTGLVAQEGDHYFVGTSRIHLGNDSSMIAKHHTNWRVRAIHSLDQAREHDQHYSSVVSVSRDDVVKIKSTLLDAIEKLKKTIKESKEEALCCLSLDFFEL